MPSNIGLPTRPQRRRETRRNPPFCPARRIRPSSRPIGTRSSSWTAPPAPAETPKVSPGRDHKTALPADLARRIAIAAEYPAAKIFENRRNPPLSRPSARVVLRQNRSRTSLEPPNPCIFMIKVSGSLGSSFSTPLHVRADAWAHMRITREAPSGNRENRTKNGANTVGLWFSPGSALVLAGTAPRTHVAAGIWLANLLAQRTGRGKAKAAEGTAQPHEAIPTGRG